MSTEACDWNGQAFERLTFCGSDWKGARKGELKRQRNQNGQILEI